jgi:hypothetical protein
MIYCHVKVQKLIRLKRKRRIMSVEEFLKDPMMKAMVEWRQKIKRLRKMMNDADYYDEP